MSGETGWLAVTLPAETTVASVADGYVAARDEAEALRQRIGARRAAAVAELEAKLESDPAHAGEVARLAELQRQIGAVEGALAEYFGERAGRVSVAAGRLLVTWGKRRETWSLAKTPAWIGSPDGLRAIGSAIWRALDGDASTVGAERAARAVLDLLGPRCREGELPAPTITVRPPAGHDDTSGGEQ